MCVLDSTKLSSASITCSLLLVLLKFVWHSSFDFCTGNVQVTAKSCIKTLKIDFLLQRKTNCMFPKDSTYVKMNQWPDILELTLNPSIRKPRVVVELSVSLHCMYLVFSTARWALSWTVGASGSTATIFSYMSLRGWGRSLASSSSPSRYVLWRRVLMWLEHINHIKSYYKTKLQRGKCRFKLSICE